MMSAILTILSAILGLLGGIVERRYSKEAIKKRGSHERGKALSEGKSKTIGLHLSNLYSRVRQNRRTPR